MPRLGTRPRGYFQNLILNLLEQKLALTTTQISTLTNRPMSQTHDTLWRLYGLGYVSTILVAHRVGKRKASIIARYWCLKKNINRVIEYFKRLEEQGECYIVEIMR